VDLWSFLTGADGGSLYNVYSGLIQAIGSLTFLGGLVAYLRHLNCHVAGCRRIDTRKVEGKEWRLCPVHHPDGRLTPERIAKHILDHGLESSNEHLRPHVEREAARRRALADESHEA